MSQCDTTRERHARAYEQMVKQAQAGDRDIAASLISDFAQLAIDPHCFDAIGGIPGALLGHIASCLGDWEKRHFKDVETHFYLARSAHAPKREIDGRHIDALREYRLQRLVKNTTASDAFLSAAELSGLSEGQVRALVQDQSKDGKHDEILERIAMAPVSPLLNSVAPRPPRKTKEKSSR